MKSLFFALFVSVFAGQAQASIIGLYYHQAGKDQIEVREVNGHPVIKITSNSFPDTPECSAGYRATREAEPVLEPIVVMDDTVVSFGLWIDRQCLESLWALPEGQKPPTKTLVQEIDVYTGMLSLFPNGEEIKNLFESGEIKLGIVAQANWNGYESSMFERSYTLDEAKAGKVLLARDEKVFDR